MSVLLGQRTAEHPDVQRLHDALQREYLDLYGEEDPDPGNSIYTARGIVVLSLSGCPVALGAWDLWENGDGKVKRMYTEPDHRGKRLGESVLAELERMMKAEGVTYVRFESGPEQASAHRMYSRAGYSRLDWTFGYYAENPGSVFFGKELV